MGIRNVLGGGIPREGFTLIELLAVIVILAIIALIATPIVLDIIEDSKDSSRKQSVNMYKSAVENAIALNNVEDGTYIIDSEGNIQYKDNKIKIDIKNYKFETGIVIIEQGQIKNIKLIEDNKIVDNKEQYNIDIWDGESLKEVVKSEDNIYHITKSSELAWLANEVNNGNAFEGEIISLDKSLNLNNKEWIPIGNSVNFFKGTFEGNNNIISGIYINKPKEKSDENSFLGLFGYAENIVLNNLIIKDSYISGYKNIGILCGRIKVKGNINNVSVYNVKIDSYTYGGIVLGTGINIELKNINSYNSEITGSELYVGGSIGIISNSTISNAYSNSIVTNTGNAKLLATGGVIGGMLNESKADNLISEAIVTGNTRVGGIVGQFQQGSILLNSKSYAKVSGTNLTGGVIGVLSSGGNLENIESYAEVEGVEEIGGIIGLLSEGNSNITNIYSKAKIKGTNKVGGIVGGFNETYETILNYKNVKSESEIIGESNTGKLWGYVDSTTILNELD